MSNDVLSVDKDAFFKHKVVLVTGSSKGIGKAIALTFAKRGAFVILNAAHDEIALRTTYEELVLQNLKVDYFLADVGNLESCTQLFEFIHRKTGTYPHILVNNAGISHVGLFTDTTPKIWQHILNNNLNSAYHCSYLAAPSMIQNQEGVIINISSIWGQVGASCEVAYSTSKSALDGFTRALAKELGPSNVRVNAISCGWIDTDMNSHFSAEEKEAFIEEIPLCRVGRVDEVANTCLFLASNEASYMTGQIIRLDGGLI
jgi:3-oxoacyl-[acyl-carrier protein] reductase